MTTQLSCYLRIILIKYPAFLYVFCLICKTYDLIIFAQQNFLINVVFNIKNLIYI